MAAELERERLFRILEKLVLWESTTDEEVLKQARTEPQVGREFRLLVPAACHVRVRHDHLAPRLQGPRGAADGEAGLLAAFAPRLLVEADAQQLQLELLDLRRLGSRHRRQQSAGRVQRP